MRGERAPQILLPYLQSYYEWAQRLRREARDTEVHPPQLRTACEISAWLQAVHMLGMKTATLCTFARRVEFAIYLWVV